MKKGKIILLVILLFILILGLGCNNQQKEIEGLKIQADEYLAKNDFNNAIELYEKILTIKEDQDIRKHLTEIMYEKESVEKAKDFLKVIKDVNINYNRPNDLVELKDVLIRLQVAIEDFEKIDITKNTEIAAYAKEVRELYDYTTLKETAYDEYIMDAEGSSSLAQISHDINIGSDLLIMNAALLGATNSNLKQHTGYILEVKIPDKYKDMF